MGPQPLGSRGTKCREFPAVGCRREHPLPAVPSPVDEKGLSAHEEVDPRDWLFPSDRQTLIAQTLHQNAGYAITLLAFDMSDTEDDEDA